MTLERLTTSPDPYEPFLLSQGIRGDSSPCTGSRPLLRRCLDWSERRPHLAGALPTALLDHMLTEKWVTRCHHRALQLTDTGRLQLAATLGFNAPR